MDDTNELIQKDAASDISKDKCWIAEKYRYESFTNSSFWTSLDSTSGWMGIPAVFLANCIMGLAALLFFTFMRKRFWDYGRIAWRLFTPGDPVLENNHDVFAHIIPTLETKPPETATADRASTLEDEDDGNFTWLYLWAVLTDEEILMKCGPSAVQYLQFQEVMLHYLSVVTSLCLMFLLPINMMGTNFEAPKYFSMTTISNLAPTDLLLFVHTFVAVGLFIHGLYTLRVFARNMNVPAHYRHYKHGIPKVAPRTTVMVKDLPDSVRANESLTRKYFSEAFPDCMVEKVQFAYDVHKLAELSIELKEARVALREAERANGNETITIRRCRMLNTFGSRCLKKVNAKLFYASEVARLSLERDKALQNAKKQPLPICFVTFKKRESVYKIMQEFRRICRFSLITTRLSNSITTSVDKFVCPHQWRVIVAPRATDIVWEYLGVDYKKWLQIVLNVIVFITLFFLSTPSIFLNVYMKVIDRPVANGTAIFSDPAGNAILRQIVPTVLILAFTALLPYAIEGCEEYSRHETKSGKELTLMMKTFVFFLFMVLFFPSFGIVSGHALFGKLFDGEDNRWDCLFLPENPAFFLNFLLTSAMVGTAVQLVRPGHIVYYIFQICCSRSRFEMENAKAGSVFKFLYGYYYAFNLVIFAVTMSYCVICPLIAPCGFFFFCMKSQVDRYNIYFAFDAHYVPVKMHRQAANCVIGCCLLSQGALMAFTIFRSGSNFLDSGDLAALSQNVFMILMFALSLAIFLFQLCTGWFFHDSNISPFMAFIGEDSDMSVSGGLVAPTGEPSSSTFALDAILSSDKINDT